MSSDRFLDAAAAIGRRIVAQAVWHERRCSWMGPYLEPEAQSRSEHRPVGPSLYDGTAGIGLFLAQLAATTGDASLRRTAAGALRHAVMRATAPDNDASDGFYGGTLGIAWAAARAGRLLGAEEPLAGAHTVMERAAAALAPGRCPDVVAGAAGSIAALVGLAVELADPSALRLACAFAEALLERATVTRHGWSWTQPELRHPHHLCGVAHGAGGVGWALLELFAATRDPRFRAAAAGAFAYEHSWLDRASGSWPDLRLPARRGARSAGAAASATWCYGEAGIGLSRQRAAELVGPGPHCLDADIAIEATRRRLTACLPYAIDDLSLCHGAGGAADALLSSADGEAAAALGRVALERHAHRGDWPCGMAGSSPGLFRGLSGIGWLFLRLHDPSTPSPLVLPRGG